MFFCKVCRYGHVQHLEQLIYYGATIDAQNGSGNTPLHICSLYNQVKINEMAGERTLKRGAIQEKERKKQELGIFAFQPFLVSSSERSNLYLNVFLTALTSPGIINEKYISRVLTVM